MRRVPCVVSAVSSGPDLSIVITLDHVMIDQHVFLEAGAHVTAFDLEDHGEHSLVIYLTGKLPEHTEIDSHGAILQDRTVMINLQLADRDVQPMLHRIAMYQHDNNGTTPAQCQPFHGVMGCNGQVTVRFTSPVRLWLLEKEQE